MIEASLCKDESSHDTEGENRNIETMSRQRHKEHGGRLKRMLECSKQESGVTCE